MNKQYRLIISNNFSLSNETDANLMTDYSPGIWAIKTQKRALQYAREILSNGDKITVTDYDQPRYHALANQFIKDLGLDQPLFEEPKPIQQVAVTNGKPSSLGQLKRYLVPGLKIRVANFSSDGTERNVRDTFIKRVQTNSIVLDKNGGDSWLEFGKASNWLFTNESATSHFIDRDGKTVPSTRLTYL